MNVGMIWKALFKLFVFMEVSIYSKLQSSLHFLTEQNNLSKGRKPPVSLKKKKIKVEETAKEKLGISKWKSGEQFKNKERTAACTSSQNFDWVLENIVGTNRKNNFKKRLDKVI